MNPNAYRPRGRIIVIESPDPMDLLQGRSEAQTLTTACRIVGYETAAFTIRSSREFAETCQYIATITKDHDDAGVNQLPIFVHISCHGNDGGLAFGADFLTWDEIVVAIRSLCAMTDYPAGCVLSVSACGAGQQKISTGLSAAFKKDRAIKPPHYLFVTDSDGVGWDDATVGWLALYHRLGKLELTNKTAIQKSIDAIRDVSGLALLYFRWDKTSKQFKRFPAQK